MDKAVWVGDVLIIHLLRSHHHRLKEESCPTIAVHGCRAAPTSLPSTCVTGATTCWSVICLLRPGDGAPALPYRCLGRAPRTHALPLDPATERQRLRHTLALKFAFSKRLADKEPHIEAQRTQDERGIWQRRYCEHLVRDDLNYQHHFDYIHVNSMKHGRVRRVCDWPYFTGQ